MPKIGDTETFKLTYGAAATWDTQQVREAILQLDPGWVGLSNYTDHRAVAYGKTDLNVSTIQAGGSFVTNAYHRSSYRNVVEGYYQQGGVKYGGKVDEQRIREGSLIQSFSTSHKTLRAVAIATGSGNILDQRGASIKGELVVQCTFIGTTASVDADCAALWDEVRRYEYPFVFKNESQHTAKLSVTYPTTDGYMSAGWWVVNPGQSVKPGRVHGNEVYCHVHLAGIGGQWVTPDLDVIGFPIEKISVTDYDLTSKFEQKHANLFLGASGSTAVWHFVAKVSDAQPDVVFKYL